MPPEDGMRSSGSKQRAVPAVTQRSRIGPHLTPAPADPQPAWDRELAREIVRAEHGQQKAFEELVRVEQSQHRTLEELVRTTEHQSRALDAYFADGDHPVHTMTITGFRHRDRSGATRGCWVTD